MQFAARSQAIFSHQRAGREAHFADVRRERVGVVGHCCDAVVADPIPEEAQSAELFLDLYGVRLRQVSMVSERLDACTKPLDRPVPAIARGNGTPRLQRPIHAVAEDLRVER